MAFLSETPVARAAVPVVARHAPRIAAITYRGQLVTVSYIAGVASRLYWRRERAEPGVRGLLRPIGSVARDGPMAASASTGSVRKEEPGV